MDLYTLVFIFVTILILIGLGLFGLLIMKIDKWIDHKERVGKQSIYKAKKEGSKEGKIS
ncbi:MAG: hypothetical protein NTX65_08195 [Ignavibacteriales bacterium]|nr:hypothetical protein [Ignavibacteriales bacterium]